MANILLVEPDYNCKYPPLGLMKIAAYHKDVHNDFVCFVKGKTNNELTNDTKNRIRDSFYYINMYGDKIEDYICELDKKLSENNWDRVYVSTLFTYEWQKTLECIDYLKTIIKADKIYTGGILATILEEDLYQETGINIISGLLEDSQVLGYGDNYNIDTMTPDYSILEMIDYEYESDNAYFAYMTRGCGMNCGFCAVQKLEPNFVPYISLKNQIKVIDEKYGAKKDLLLMDNNVLKSTKFDDIIDEIVELGFGIGDTFLNPVTKMKNKRSVDFNQGLDAYLMTEHKAKRLGEIATRPARVAFDHIEDKDVYFKAIGMLAESGIRYLSNYILYNANSFGGKGTRYKADSPSDLYNRLKYNVNFVKDFNAKNEKGSEQLKLFSFPMRYRPLDAKSRGNASNSVEDDNHDFVGDEWCLRHLRAIQSMLRPTQGKGVSSISFFDASFGNSLEEFLITIDYPEQYIVTRGLPTKVKNKTELEMLNVHRRYNKFENLRKEWQRLVKSLNEVDKEIFLRIIKNVEIDEVLLIREGSDDVLKLLTHYYQGFNILTYLDKLLIDGNSNQIHVILNYIKNDCKDLMTNLVDHLSYSNANTTVIKKMNRYFSEELFNIIISKLKFEKYQNSKLIRALVNLNSDEKNYKSFYVIKWAIILDLIDDSKSEVLMKKFNSEYDSFFEEIKLLKVSIFDELDQMEVDNKQKILWREIESEIELQLSFV